MCKTACTKIEDYEVRIPSLHIRSCLKMNLGDRDINKMFFAPTVALAMFAA